MTKRVYLYVIDDSYCNGDASSSFFKDGIPSVTPFDVDIFMSEVLLFPGMSYEIRGSQYVIGTLHNLRLSPEDPVIRAYGDLKGFSNDYPLNPESKLNVIIVTPATLRKAIPLREIGSVVDWASDDGSLVANLLTRHVDTNEDAEDSVRIRLK